MPDDVNQVDQLLPIPELTTGDEYDCSGVTMVVQSLLHQVPIGDLRHSLSLMPDDMVVGAQMLAQAAAHLFSDERRRRGETHPEQTC